MNILLLNGPNLNMLGVRQPQIYGRDTLADIEKRVRKLAAAHKVSLDFRQSNHEGELVTWIQQARKSADGIVINPAAYTHTSLAILDALMIFEKPVIEVHLSNPHQREKFRHFSYASQVATATIAGLGAYGYEVAFEAMVRILKSGKGGKK
jgi:3-dehydroquinate dehydratase-2